MTSSYDYQKFWDRFGDASWYSPSQRHRFRLVSREVSRILGRSGKGRPVRLLDLGCGKGDLLAMLMRRYPNVEYVGIDIAEATIGELQDMLPDAGWYVADMQQPMDVARYGQFDIVICSEVLEHIEQDRAVLDNIRALTAADGWVILTVPGGRRYKMDEALGHLRHYELDDLRDSFDSESMKVAHAYSWGYPFLNLFRFTTNLFYDSVSKNFLDVKYTWRQKAFCEILYRLMFVNIPRQGIQRICVFSKAADVQRATP